MEKNAVAIVLDEISTLLELQGENRFKARAFANAARAVQSLQEDLATLVAQGRLESVAGIGPATAAVIRDLVTTGTSRYYEELRQRTPPGLLELLAVPRLGASRIRLLHDELGVKSLDDLEAAARAGRVAKLPGFGTRTEAKILEGIAWVRGSTGRRRYAEIVELATRLHGFVASLPGVQRVEHAGEYRRLCETATGLALIAEVDAAAAAEVLAQFAALPGAATSTNADAAVIRMGDGFQLRLSCVSREAFATTWLVATGSEAHVRLLQQEAAARGLRLESDGLFRGRQRVPTPDEADIYRALDLAWVPPELRETGEEISAARNSTLPAPIRYEDLHGCFHCHTHYSDGRVSPAEMAEAAIARGWRYLGIADHSRYAAYAGGLTPERVFEQHAEIDAWNEKHGDRLWLFKGIEADVLPDGRVDFEDEPGLLERFDFVIASIHSSFDLPKEQQTRRVLRVLENPHVTFLGHLTGRLLLSRRGCELDLDAIFKAAAERGVAIEINADPRRMELDWRHWPRAAALGVRTAINPDAHSPAQLDFVHYGVNIARKGWLEIDRIANCWSLDEVRAFFRRSRA